VTLTVVAAVIEVEGAFLLTKRQPGVHLSGHWEFPGGKVQAGETHEAALAREMVEELDAHVKVHECVFEIAHQYDDREIHLHFYRCTLEGVPRPLLGQEMRWVERTDLASLPFPEADRGLVEALSQGAPAKT
jgi:8-oxo-dGTP diphosphatase